MTDKDEKSLVNRAELEEKEREDRVKAMTKEQLETEILNQYKVSIMHRASYERLAEGVKGLIEKLKAEGVKRLPKLPAKVSGLHDLGEVDNLSKIVGTTSKSTITTIKGLRKTADAYSRIAGVLRDIYNTVFKRPDVFMDDEEYEIFKNEVCEEINFDRDKEYNPEDKDFPKFVVNYLETVSRRGAHYKGRCIALEGFKETLGGMLIDVEVDKDGKKQ